MSDTIAPAVVHKAPESTKAAFTSWSSTMSVPLYEDRGGKSLIVTLDIVKADTEGYQSSQGVNTGRKEHPYDRYKVKRLEIDNEHHATCLSTKVASTVGLGFLTDEEKKARKAITGGDITAKATLMSIDGISTCDKVLNPLCDNSWQETLSDVCRDYWSVADGYLEVVRDDAGDDGLGPITGVHHIPAEQVYVFMENSKYDRHYEIVGGEGANSTRRFARFGDLAGFRARNPNLVSETDRISEVIDFRQPTALCRWYGFSDWISAVAAIELVQSIRQYNFDFFRNRGVPEFFMFILGQKLSKEEWAVVENAMQSNVGRGNSHKSFAMNLSNENIKIQVEKMMADGKGENTFGDMNESLSLSIVTAHRVPPLLAGIVIPGKMAATNELPNVLQAFQTLVIGPTQQLFQQTLGATLGNPEKNGGLKLKPEDFTFRRITEQFDLGAMDTIARMKTTVPEANAQGRNIEAGLKKEDVGFAQVVRDMAENKGQHRLVGLMDVWINEAA